MHGQVVGNDESGITGSSDSARRVGRRLPAPAWLALIVTALLGAFVAGAAVLPSARPSQAAGRVTAAPPAAPVPAVPQSPPPAVRGVGGFGTREVTASPTTKASPPVQPRAANSPRPSKPPATATGSAAESAPDNVTARENQVTVLVNRERTAGGCGTVSTDERLRTAARRHSRDMAQRNYFSHDSPDGSSPWDRADRAGYPNPIGENIAKGQPTPAAVVDAWMNSPGHRRNIMNCDAREIGVGLAFDGSTPVWTQLFGAG